MSPSVHPERERPTQNYKSHNPTVFGQLQLLHRLTLRGSKRESWGDAGVKGDTGLQAWGPYLRASLLASALLETLGLRSQGGYQCGKDGLPWPGWGKQ